VRRSDVVRLGDALRKGNRFSFVASENRSRKPMTVNIPILPQLQTIIAASDLGAEAHLCNGTNKPF